MRTYARIVLVAYATHLKRHKTKRAFGLVWFVEKDLSQNCNHHHLITSQRAVRDIDAPNAHTA
jgi:uncharacterized protein YlbG (UPF0298 family)